MITIPLSQGKIAVVDDLDGELAQFKWSARRTRRRLYAMRRKRSPDGRWTTEQLHRAVWSRAHPGEEIPIQLDHWDRDGLNCRRHNLRPASRAQNQHNVALPSTNTSGFKGISWYDQRRRWDARIRVNGMKLRLGYYTTREEAALAYDAAARALHGEFATLNFPNHNEKSALDPHMAVGDLS